MKKLVVALRNFSNSPNKAETWTRHWGDESASCSGRSVSVTSMYSGVGGQKCERATDSLMKMRPKIPHL